MGQYHYGGRRLHVNHPGITAVTWGANTKAVDAGVWPHAMIATALARSVDHQARLETFTAITPGEASGA